MTGIHLAAVLAFLISSSHAWAMGEKDGDCLFMVAQLPIVKDSQIQASLERAMKNAIREEEALSQIVKRLHTLEVTGGPDALFSLSILNEMGSCVEANPVKARFLLTRAAELGNADAQTYLGLKQTDCKQAVYWWEKAALQGDASALKALARTYHTGCPTVEKDSVLALMWLTICDVSGIDTVIPNLERHNYIDGMRDDQIAEAERLAREWVDKNLKK